MELYLVLYVQRLLAQDQCGISWLGHLDDHDMIIYELCYDEVCSLHEASVLEHRCEWLCDTWDSWACSDLLDHPSLSSSLEQ